MRCSLPHQATLVALVLLVIAVFPGCSRSRRAEEERTRLTEYDVLVTFFQEWREFQAPVLGNGVPDYSSTAMAGQHRALPAWQQRLEAFRKQNLSLPEQVDWHLVRAEMHGLDFDHRVLRPWANNPAFYVTAFGSESDQPAREGPLAHGAVEFWQYSFPLKADDAAAIGARIRAIPPLLEQARRNLVGNHRDLWVYAPRPIRQQAADLAAFASRLGDEMASLGEDVQRAKEATERFAEWVEAQAESKTGASGVGIENYDWYLRHVHLVPYSWRDQVILMERELARAHMLLAAEEQRNQSLPPQHVIASTEEHAARFPEAITEYMSFLEDRGMLTVKPYMEPSLRARIGRFRAGPREFFTEVDYRDPVVMRTHGFHWFDKAAMIHEPAPSPIRAIPLLYNIFDTRTEGLATGWEEWAMAAGLLDERPRSRELIYILVAQRAARALGDLRMHANQWTLEEAAAFASENTPRGWLRLTGNLVRGEQHLYLQQPSYGTSYLIGKIQIEELVATRRRQLGDRFSMKGFMDEFTAAGLIPMSLITWELTEEMPELLRAEPPTD
jgi:hypothetical protein